MSRNKVLLIVFVILLVVFLGKRFFSTDTRRNFREILVELDTAQITKISLLAKANSGATVDIMRTGNQWEVTDGTVIDEVDEGGIREMLSSMVSMKPKRLVAKTDDKWAQYEVNDSLGTKVTVYAGNDELSSFIIGKFNFQQATRSMSTFVRLANEDEVYSIEGFLSSTFNQQFSNLRDKTFLKTDKTDLTRLQFDYPGDSSFVLSKEAELWSVNGVATDSTAVQTYLNGIQNITQREFVDGFSADGKVSTYRLTIEGNNMNTIVVNGYATQEDIVLHSSLNDNAYFNKGTLQVFEKLFVSSTQFFKTESDQIE